MEGLDTYQLYQQLLSGDAHLGAQDAPLFQPPPLQPPMLGGQGHDHWAIDPAGYLATDGYTVLPQPLQIPGGGVWAGNDGGFVPGGGGWAPGLTSQMPVYQPAPMDYPQLPTPMDYPQPPTPMDYPQPPPPAPVDAPQAVPDEEEAEVAQMVRVAMACGDMASTVWSEEENQLLRDGLSRFADQNNVTKCFSIASGLAKKTVLDVAYRIRWLSDVEKKRAAEQARLEQEQSAEAKITKGKGPKGATRKNNRYPLSKEVLNSKSAKELLRDNDRLMHKIEEILKTGQVNNSPDYFYYVKMNMDALRNKVTDESTVLDGLLVDDEEWADVLKDRHSPQA